jgi:uncharacterized protein YfdQ (DUF2303 family)
MQDNQIAEALAAGAALGDIKMVNDTPVAVVPTGYQLHRMENLLDTPTRAKGTTKLFDADSFIRFVEPYVSVGDVVKLFYVIDPKPEFVAVLNAALPGRPDWGDLRAEYAAPLSKEWQAWAAMDGKAMNQQQFALFIERNLLDIAEPSGAEMLELSLNFQAKKNVNFASGTRLSNGQTQLVYEETIQSKAGEKGQLSIPDEIVLLLPVFEGSKMGDRLTAKFRYRIDGGKLDMWYELVRPHKVLEVATHDLLEQIELGIRVQGFKGLPTA